MHSNTIKIIRTICSRGDCYGVGAFEHEGDSYNVSLGSLPESLASPRSSILPSTFTSTKTNVWSAERSRSCARCARPRPTPPRFPRSACTGCTSPISDVNRCSHVTINRGAQWTFTTWAGDADAAGGYGCVCLVGSRATGVKCSRWCLHFLTCASHWPHSSPLSSGSWVGGNTARKRSSTRIPIKSNLRCWGRGSGADLLERVSYNYSCSYILQTSREISIDSRRPLIPQCIESQSTRRTTSRA